MTKLKRFKKNKINTKSVLISFAVIIGIMMITIISKSYAIYKLEKKYDLIQSKIGTYTMGDVRVAVLVDGKEASEFPSYETNYKVEGIECTNGVTASFDVENWQINIADMSSTSTKCTVSFNSKETNETTPINYTKSELVALNESMTDTFKSSLKKELLNDTYPVGSIYMSTSDDTVEKVQEKFGGTWVAYAEGRTLIGVGTGTDINQSNKSFIVNETGGEYVHTLSVNEMPSHSHYPRFYDSNVSAVRYFGYGSVNDSSNNKGFNSVVNMSTRLDTTSTGGSQSHNNVQPYTAVYMYKRTA